MARRLSEEWTEEYNCDKLFWEMLGLEMKTVNPGEMKDLMNSEDGEERRDKVIVELIAQNFDNVTIFCTYHTHV